MRRLLRRLVERLPLQFRVLYRQFLLRVVDLEALSIEADVTRLLGQMAGILILYGVLTMMGLLMAVGRAQTAGGDLLALLWKTQHNFLSMTMLVAGLMAVISWDQIFPDRRDVMILGALPVRSFTILLAKIAAAGAVLGVAVLSLNLAISVALSLVAGGFPGFLRNFAAYWWTTMAAALFVYGSVLAVQGCMALLLPRRWFLRTSSVSQLAAFAWFLASYFLEPGIGTTATIATEASRGLLNRWPSFWFFAMLQQLRGRLPPSFDGLAGLAWIGLGIALCAAGLSLMLCYLRTMKKTVEEPDLLPGGRGWRWRVGFGDRLQQAIVGFSVRSLARSRQHRVVYAFFLSVAFAIAVSTLREILSSGARRELTTDFLMPTLTMMCLAVVGLRSIFSLPVSLHANWVLQVTQLRAPEHYISASRRALLAMAVVPVWVVASLLSLGFRPWPQVVAHLLVLALVGSILADLSLIGVSKIPFACSYLPGKSNIQYMFWAFGVIFLPIAMEFSNYEVRAIQHPGSFAVMMAILGPIASGIWAFNRRQSKSAVLYYEELPAVVIMTLGLGSGPLRAAIEMPAASKPKAHSS
jgi:hypothetical protein